MELLLLGVPWQQRKTSITSMPLQVLRLTRNAVYAVSWSPDDKPTLGFILIALLLLIPNKVHYVVPANLIISTFRILFFILYFIRLPAFPLPHFAVL